MLQLSKIIVGDKKINPKKAGGSIWPPLPRSLSKNVISKNSVKPYFLLLLKFLLSYTFLENFIQISKVVQKIERFSSSILTAFIIFLNLHPTSNRLLGNCSKSGYTDLFFLKYKREVSNWLPRKNYLQKAQP